MYTNPGTTPAGVNSLYVCTACRERGVWRNRCSFVTTQMVDRNEGLDLPADSRFYTCAESEKLYHHCCIDSADTGACKFHFHSELLRPRAVVESRREEDTRGDRTKNRRDEPVLRDKPGGKCGHRRDNTEDGTVSRIYPAKVNRVSGTHKSIGKKRSNKVRIEFVVNVKGKR